MGPTYRRAYLADFILAWLTLQQKPTKQGWQEGRGKQKVHYSLCNLPFMLGFAGYMDGEILIAQSISANWKPVFDHRYTFRETSTGMITAMTNPVRESDFVHSVKYLVEQYHGKQ